MKLILSVNQDTRWYSSNVMFLVFFFEVTTCKKKPAYRARCTGEKRQRHGHELCKIKNHILNHEPLGII